MKSILVIRRDNIGDLVCTTPLIHALRMRFPEARIDALVNSYNLPVVAHNPDLNNAYAYTKAKHRGYGESIFGVTFRRMRLMWQLRATRYDLIVLANGECLVRPLRLAKIIGGKNVLGFFDATISGADLISMPVELPGERVGHEVEALFLLLVPLGITPPPGPLVLRADPLQAGHAQQTLGQQSWNRRRPTLAVHISARKPSQRWPADKFVAVLERMVARHDVQFMLFWAPGDEDNPMHPGDDRKAAAIMKNLPNGFPLLAWPTNTLPELIGGLSACQGMLCSDGGGMHIGAALGLPIVCFFGQSEVATWHPWGVPYRVLQPASREVTDVTEDEVLAALDDLWPQMEHVS